MRLYVYLPLDWFVNNSSVSYIKQELDQLNPDYLAWKERQPIPLRYKKTIWREQRCQDFQVSSSEVAGNIFVVLCKFKLKRR